MANFNNERNEQKNKKAIEQIDEAQPLCLSPECDKLADAAMNIDLVVSELEGRKMSTKKAKDILKHGSESAWECEGCMGWEQVRDKALAELELAKSEPESCVGSDRLREKRGNPDDLPVIDSFSEGDPSKPEPGKFTTEEARIFFKTGLNMVGCTSWESMKKLVEGLVKVGLKACKHIDSLQEQLEAKKKSSCVYCKGTRRVEAFAGQLSLGWGRCPHCASDVLEKQIAAKQKELENAAKICIEQANEIVAKDTEIERLTDCLLTLKDTSGAGDLELIEQALKGKE